MKYVEAGLELVRLLIEGEGQSSKTLGASVGPMRREQAVQ